MPTREQLYHSVQTIRTPGFHIEKIGEDAVSPIQTPFRAGFIEDFSRLIVNRRSSKSFPEFIQISPSQKRSFEMRLTTPGFIFWDDEFGNLYGVLQEKGGNVTNPDARIEKRAPSGFIIWGLQDSDSILRTVRASNFMRSHNIATEAIVHLAEPSQLQFKGETVSREVFRQRLVEMISEKNHRKNSKNHDGWRAVTREDLPKLAAELNEMTFYISTLGRQVSERFHDLTFAKSPQDLKKVMTRVFTFWNAKQRLLSKQGQVEGEPEVLDIENPLDLVKYLSSILPKEIAENYAKLHNLGLVHTYPHLGNVSLVGSIYDTDSVYGEPLGLGDQKVTDEQIMADVECLIDGKDGWHQADGIRNLLDDLEDEEILPPETKINKEFSKTFALNYLLNRGWADDFSANFDNIVKLFEICHINKDTMETGQFKEDLMEKLGKDNFALLAKNITLRGYKYPQVVSIRSGSLGLTGDFEISGKEELSEERKKQVNKFYSHLLDLHESNLEGQPSSGEDYFKFPIVSGDIIIQQAVFLNDRGVFDLVQMFVEDNLKDNQDSRSSKAVGSFFLSLCQLNTDQVEYALNSLLTGSENTLPIDQLSRIKQLVEIIPAGGSKIHDAFRDYLVNSYKNIHERHDTRQEIEERAAIALFGYGIITEDLSQIFNHQKIGIIMNEFDIGQVDALIAGMECPNRIDPWLGKNMTTQQIALGLAGVYARNSDYNSLFVLRRVLGNQGPAYMQALLASEAQEASINSELNDLLKQKVESGSISHVSALLIKMGKTVHPDSFFAKSLETAEIEATDLVNIIKTAIDLTNGDLEKMDSTIKRILEGKEYTGEIEAGDASDLALACIGFGIDIPEIIDPLLKQKENRYAFTDFMPRGMHIFREGDNFERGDHYPINPAYAFMSRGVEALPDKLRDFFIEFADDSEVINKLARKSLRYMFWNGYFENYFGSVSGYQSYPESGITMRDMYKTGWQLWRIVHPDVWDILRTADTQTLQEAVSAYTKNQKVKMEMRRDRLVGSRVAPIWQCLPRDIYQRIAS